VDLLEIGHYESNTLVFQACPYLFKDLEKLSHAIIEEILKLQFYN
jgi:hypothetical protein